MGKYTPTTKEVKRAYVSGMRLALNAPSGVYAAEFDRWLAALIREAKAEAWDEAVAMVSGEEHALVHSGWGTVVSKLTIIRALRARAAEYRKGESDDQPA